MGDFSGYVFEPLRDGGEFALYRGRRPDTADSILLLAPAAPSADLERLEHEHSFAEELDSAWAVRPLALARHNGQTVLLLEDPGGDPLDRLLGQPLELTRFLVLAISLAATLRQVHRRGLIHKDVNPTNFLIDGAGNVRLTGFGVSSRLPRERQTMASPKVIAGRFPYMAPEQTGRMNCTIDARSDLYSLGITLYEMLTGGLPFTASDPMEWVHCHIARRPTPPNERVSGVPDVVAAIVMKLLAKTAEDRYQTAAGIEADLRRCLAAWKRYGRIDPFPLAEQDASGRLLIPDKLYGRDAEIRDLTIAFNRVRAHGTTQFVLVSGYAGIGKSSIVHELHKLVVPPRGLFASGKFDQYKRDIPYATLAQAFQSLILELLGKSEAELRLWQQTLSEALGQNGQLIVNLIPELSPIIGDQPPVLDLPPRDAKTRFHLVFRRFLSVFARPEHPLALFLDDLQWLDTATLELIERLVTDPEVKYLLLIGAYRDNEVDAAHPLMRTLQTIREAGASVGRIMLGPLAFDDVATIVATALHATPERIGPLAELVFEKTGGNPFFAIQFLIALTEEGLLAFDQDLRLWQWDVDRIRAKGMTDNIVDLMVGKLARLTTGTQDVLKLFACVGNSAPSATLGLVLGRSEGQIDAALAEAIDAGLILDLDRNYAFRHDRVQEAAYALIPDTERAPSHLRIGRILVSSIPESEIGERIFEIVNHLNRGASLIEASAEREQLARLNLIAGRRAKTSTAYAAALTYFASGCACLDEESWDRLYRLRFDLELHRAECEFLTGDLANAEERLAMLSQRAAGLIDLAAVACRRVAVYTTLDRPDSAIRMGLDYLRHVGIAWTPHPTDDDVREEYQRISLLLGSRPIEALLDLPAMNNPSWIATMDVLAEIIPPALFTDNNLHSLTICRMVNLSLEHGNCDGSCHSYVWFGMLSGPRFGDYAAGFRFGKLASDLTEQRQPLRVKARAYLGFAYIVSWMKHLHTGLALLRRAFDAAQETGDLTFAGYSSGGLVTHLLAAGAPLLEAQSEAEKGLDFAKRARFGIVAAVAKAQLGLIRTLRGMTPVFGSFDDGQFDEKQHEKELATAPHFAYAAWRYWVRKLQARCYAADYDAAIEAAGEAERLLSGAPSLGVYFETAEYHLYAALARAAACDSASADEREKHIAALLAHHRQLLDWTENCPENFEDRTTLVGAEIARLEGRELDAMNLYEKAIQSARDQGFTQNEAIAHESAARFYAARGFETIANAYLQNAKSCYLRWGATAKARQLDAAHPQRLQAMNPARPNGGAGASIEHLDLATVIKISQAVSSEIDLKKLIDSLMAIAIEHAGADRGLLIFPQGEALQIEAEAITRRGSIDVLFRPSNVTPGAYPESIIRYVIRTQSSVLLEDVSDQHPFSHDDYLYRRQCRSVLVLPLIKQAKMAGVLYLENSQASHAFTPERIAVLKLLASQAASSLENARLYTDLQRTESYLAEAQRLSHTGSFVFGASSGKLSWSDEVYRIYEIDRETKLTLEVGLRRTHPEERSLVRKIVENIPRDGKNYDLDHRLLMPDGSVKYLHIVVHAEKDETGDTQFLGTVMDVTASKEAQMRLEASLGEMQKLVSIIENSTDFIGYAPDLDRVGYINAAGRKLVGLEPEDDVSRYKLSDFRAANEDHQFFLDEILPILAREGYWEGERSLRHFKTNAAIPVLQTIFYVTERETNRRIAIATICRDITEQKRIDESLRASLEEKEALLKEVHHRVKNNLQLISSLLNLQAAGIADPAVVERFAESRNRVRSMALVHENLYRAGNFAKIQMKDHIQNLCAQLIRAYGLQGQHVALTAEIDDIELDLDRAISAGLIVNELVSNALKHAFPKGRMGQVQVLLKRLDAEQCALSVVDDGLGLPLAYEAERSGSLGLQLVDDLTHQLHGKIAVEREGGTAFTITFNAGRPIGALP
jgi:predicted ATPase/two-component sensor histidine kinase/GAF domain-containing protein